MSDDLTDVKYDDYYKDLKEKKATKNVTESTKPDYYLLPTDAVDIGDAVEHLPFWQANAIKYIYRADSKGTPDSNLQKAIECLQRELQRRKKVNSTTSAILNGYKTQVFNDSPSLRQARETNKRWDEQLHENPPFTEELCLTRR